MLKRIFILILIFSGLLLTAQVNRNIDGFDNNKKNPEWGSAGSVMPSLVSNGFADKIGSPGGEFRPNARVVSNQIFDQEISIADKRNLSEFVWSFGQFLDHDISRVLINHNEYYPIPIPTNDLYFLPGSHIPFVRSYYSQGSGQSIENPRSYNNEITSFIDASNVYGSNEFRAAWLRSYNKGKLVVSSGDYLPWNSTNFEFNGLTDNNAPAMDDDVGNNHRLFVAGDVRANEHPMLIVLHTLFVREHNRLCDSLSMEYPSWDDELIYQKARKLLGAFLQKITFEDWLPALGIQLREYEGYDPELNPGILNEFSAAAFRLGHTLIRDDVVRLKYNGDTILQGNIDIKEAFFNPSLISLTGGIEPYILGVISRSQQLSDTKIVNGLRNFLFGNPEEGGLDLASINIMRGRDRGLPDYNQIRSDYSLPSFSDFTDISNDILLIDNLRFLYGNIDNIDPWVGMLAEKHLEDKMFGELLNEMIYTQFLGLRNGDRYYYENDAALSDNEKNQIRQVNLKKIIERNSDLQGLPNDVFYVEELEEDIQGPELINVQLDAVAYPNPTKDQLTLKFISLEDAAHIQIRLLDPMGKLISSSNLIATEGDNFYPMDLGSLSPGVYYIFLENDKHFKLLTVRKDD